MFNIVETVLPILSRMLKSDDTYCNGKYYLPTGFLSMHISSEQFLAQLIKLLFKQVGKLFEESVGRNISRYDKNSLVKQMINKTKIFLAVILKLVLTSLVFRKY
jgi:hypothetical protein